jgi:2-polyprenyl-6-methoxyphenol hydroxylase-like FAD-dependent oxidoreductase
LKPISIIGGGLAGLSLGILLRHRSVPVQLFEARKYPRHKVCGEFISGRGLEALAALGLEPFKLGRPVKTITFHRGARTSKPSPLPQVGVAIARFDLDFALAEEFSALGGDLHCPVRFTAKTGEQGAVFATGRRLHSESKGKWYGLKAHLTNVEPVSDLELHFSSNGYVGLCRLDAERTNICALFRRNPGEDAAPPDRAAHFKSVASLTRRLEHARWDPESFAAVSGLSLYEAFSPDTDRFAIGDALSMIPPFSGNGMSVALESAGLAVDPLIAYTSGELSWAKALQSYHSRARARFDRRLGTAALVQKLAVKPFWTSLFLKATNAFPLWRAIFAATR